MRGDRVAVEQTMKNDVKSLAESLTALDRGVCRAASLHISHPKSGRSRDSPEKRIKGRSKPVVR